MEVALTKGAIAAISEGSSDGLKPVLQVAELRLLPSSQGRYRALLSDGTHQLQAMFSSQMSDMIKSGGDLQNGSIVRLNEYSCSDIRSRQIIIIIKMELLVSKSHWIGEQSRAPATLQSGGSNQPSAAAGHPASYDGSNNPVVRQSTTSGTNLNPKMERVTMQSGGSNQPSGAAGHPQSYGGSNNPIVRQSTMSGTNLNPKMEQVNSNPSYGVQYSRQRPGTYTDQHMGVGNQNQRFSKQAVVGGYHRNQEYQKIPLFPLLFDPSRRYEWLLPSYANRRPITKNEAPARTVPISSLNPYQGRWTIKARVTAKAELRHYNNPRGEGKVFSFYLLDSDGGEIRVTCFNTEADQFYDQIQAGKVYLISNGTLQPANKNFNHLNNDYEISLDTTSTIQPYLEEDNTIPMQQFNFRPISEIENMEKNSTLDVIGIVTSISPAGTIIRKNGNEVQKRSLQLKDMSGRSVELTLWGSHCQTEGQQLQDMCDSGSFPVLAVKAGRVNEFKGKLVGTIFTTQLFIDPDFPDAHSLKEWYSREGKNVSAVSISRNSRKTVSQIKDEGLGRSEKPDWITLKATISTVKDNLCYTACPLMMGDRQCNKKVSNSGDGNWHCDRCDQSFPQCDYQYMLNLQIQDHTGMTWVTAFGESGEQILGVPAKEIYLLKYEERDEAKFGEIIHGIHFNQYMFTLIVKEETSDEQKLTVRKAEKVNPSLESRFLMGLIDNLLSENHNGSPGMHRTYVNPSTSNFGGDSASDLLYRNGPMNISEQPVNEYGGVVNHGFGTREPLPFCNKCGSSRHDFMNCPNAVNEHVQYAEGFVNRALNAAMGGGNSGNVCFKCQQTGHWARDCPGMCAAPPVYGSSSVSRYTGSNTLVDSNTANLQFPKK